MKPHPILVSLAVLMIWALAVQVTPAQSAILDAYIREGLGQNERIKQQGYLGQQRRHALEEAKGLGLPSVSLNGSYTLAAGGRAISIPVGDMLNPVYTTLNELTGTNSFPQLENVDEQLNPNNFYDLKLRAAYPLYNPDVRYNKQLKEQMTNMSELDIAVAQKSLAEEIRVAYFNYLQAQQAISIYREAMGLLQESRRVNQKLFDNGVANYTVVTRAANEITKMEAQIAEAENNARNAASYFNFLLNRPLDSAIEADPTFTDVNYPFPQQVTGTPGSREELRQLALVNAMQETNLKWKQTYKLPRVNAFLDAGSQGFNFEVGNGSLYMLGGLSIELPLYSGNTNVAKVKQAQMEVAASASQQAYVAGQLNLQWENSLRSYQSALEVFNSTKSQVESAARYYRDIEKRYREGQALYIEFLDARNELTQARLQQSLYLLKVWSNWAGMERAK
jgi:outer membrane protein TolC